MQSQIILAHNLWASYMFSVKWNCFQYYQQSLPSSDIKGEDEVTVKVLLPPMTDNQG